MSGLCTVNILLQQSYNIDLILHKHKNRDRLFHTSPSIHTCITHTMCSYKSCKSAILIAVLC